MVDEAFDAMGLSEVRLEVFHHNARAIGAYRRVGFEVTGEHVEWVPRKKTELRVIEMRLSRDTYRAGSEDEAGPSSRRTAADRQKRRQRRVARKAIRARRHDQRAADHENVSHLAADPDSERAPAMD